MTDNPNAQDLPTDRHERADVMYERVTGTPRPAMSDTWGPLSHDHVFGDVWSRPGLDIRIRRAISMTCAAMTGADLALRSHLASAARTGDLSPEELREIGVHLGHYGGLPVGATYYQALRAAEAAAAAEG